MIGSMKPYIIRTPVPTPEEMAKILGMSPERVTVLREIMGAPLTESGTKKARRHIRTAQKPAFKSKSAKLDAKSKGVRGKSAPR